MRKSLTNFYKPVDQFATVSFVNSPNMTHHQLKLLVKRLWSRFHTLANALDKSNPIVSKAIDTILDDSTPNLHAIPERYSFYNLNTCIIQHDSATNTIKIMHNNTHISGEISAITYEQVKKLLHIP